MAIDPAQVDRASFRQGIERAIEPIADDPDENCLDLLIRGLFHVSSTQLLLRFPQLYLKVTWVSTIIVSCYHVSSTATVTNLLVNASTNCPRNVKYSPALCVRRPNGMIAQSKTKSAPVKEVKTKRSPRSSMLATLPNPRKNSWTCAGDSYVKRKSCERPMLLVTHYFGSHSSTLFPSGSNTHANRP